MASKTVAATIDGQCMLKTITNYNSSPTYQPAGAYDIGYDSSFGNSALVIKFTTPLTYAGLSTSITVGFTIWQAGYAYAPMLRYAVCTSDKNWMSYNTSPGAVTDSYQLVSGSTTVSFPMPPNGAHTTHSWTINVANLEPATSYYLFIWGYSTSAAYVKTDAAETHSVTVTYNEAVVYIDNGSGFEAYTAFIDDGTKWVPCIPYRDNGSSWDILG